MGGEQHGVVEVKRREGFGLRRGFGGGSEGAGELECFVEGGRSRTGKLLPPKFGILSYMLDSVASGRVEDAIICPVSTQYDKVIEVE